MAFTKNFIFSDAVPAQQAVQYAQLANQEQAQADQAFNERMRNATQGRIAQNNSQQQMMMSQNQMAQRAAEAEKDRALQREGYGSAEKVAGLRADVYGDKIKAQQTADDAFLKRQALENFSRGNSFAETLNNPATPLHLKQKLMESGDVVMGPDGLWRSRHANPNPVESIDSIRAALQPVKGIPGSMGVGGRLPAAMDTIPSRSRMLQMRPPPSTPDFPSAPDGPSPFETPGFRVFRQSDFAPQPVSEVPVDQPWMQPAY